MHLIPTFPEQTPLLLGHRPVLQPYLLENRNGISELSMASLYPFTEKRHYTVSRYVTKENKEAFLFRGLQVIGDKKETFAILPSGYPNKEIIEKLFDDGVSEINTIGEHNWQEWEQKIKEDNLNLTINVDRDNADYIYERQSLIDLVGQSLHKKLAHAQKFAEDNPDRVVVPTHLAKSGDMVKILDEWAEGKDVVEDYKATLLAIQCRDELNLKGIVLYAGNNPVAFTLGEQDTDERYIIHVEKALGNYRGVYQYINRSFAMEMPESVIEINREQDLGIPGLRQAKLTYKPSRFLMKYKIREST